MDILEVVHFSKPIHFLGNGYFWTIFHGFKNIINIIITKCGYVNKLTTSLLYFSLHIILLFIEITHSSTVGKITFSTIKLSVTIYHVKNVWKHEILKNTKTVGNFSG